MGKERDSTEIALTIMHEGGSQLLKWLIVFVLAMSLIGWFTPLLRRLGLGRLPGDIRFVFNGREYSFPFASSLLLSALMTWLFYLVR